MTMKLLKVHVAVTTLVSCVDAMVSVSAVTPNSLIARQDSLSLLELFRRHPAPVSEHDVGPMLKSAESALMNLATSHRSAPLADLVAQIRPFITQMQDSIRVAHTTAQQTLTDLKNDIDGCNTIKTTGDAEASALEAAKTTYSTNHKSCRTAEKTTGNELDGCTETLDALEGAKSSSCQLYEDAKQTPGCGGIPANSGETWESYTERAADYFAQERDDFKHKKAVCLNDTAKLEDKKKKCLGSDATLKKTYDDTKLQCNGYQSQLESSTCSYVSKVNSTCHSFAACANTLADSFDAQNAGIRTLEQQRKVEWNATERLLCLLDVYGGSGDVDATKLQTCHHMADNTSHLNLLYPIAPQRPDPCQDLLPHPCEADYTSQEYGALDAPALQCTPCAFASSANGGWTLVLRQTMPFLYQASQWSLNPTDPSNDNYAILDRLEDFRVDGKFEFKLVWPADGLQEQHWKQTSNFVTRTQSGVTGYEAISTPYTDQYWGGLEYNNHVALADGSVSHGNWFYAVGATHVHHGGIPMDHATKESASQTELWVKGPGSSPPPPASCSRQARYWKLTVTAGGTYGTGPDVDGHYCFGGYGPYGFAIYDGSSNRILPSAVECTECRGSYGDSALLGSFTNGQHWCVWSPHNNGRSVLTITFAQDVTPAEYKFDCGGSSNCATSWTIEQSMDGTSWTEIETQTNRPPNNPQEYALQSCPAGGGVTAGVLVTDKTPIKLQNQQGSLLDPEWIMKKCYATQPENNWKPPAPWTDSPSLPATADEVIYTCDVVALWIVGVDKVQDCAHGGCSQQPYPPPSGHWGTPYRPQKEGKPCGDPIHVGDAIYFDRLMSDAWTGSHFLTQSGNDLSGGTVKTIFNVQGQAPANTWNQGALWSEDFESGQTGWQGQSTSAFHSGPECYGGSGSCWKFNQCNAGGDLFAVGYTIPSACQGACTLTYWYKGMVLAGTDADGHKGSDHDWWPHSTGDIPPSSDWVERTITGVSHGGRHLMLETYAGTNCVSYLDNIMIQQDS